MRRLVIVLLAVVLLGSIGVAFVIREIRLASGYSASSLSRRDCALDEPPLDLVGCIRNEEVQWDGTGLGLLPRLSGASAKLLKTKENIEPLLLTALMDEDKFVAAHVLLTFRSPIEFREERGAWNGLRVQLLTDGHVSYEGNDLAELHRRWEEVLQQQEPNGK